MEVEKDLNSEAIGIWDANAAWWDEQTGEGNVTQRVLIMPAIERLLELRPGQTVLEIACGNGYFARRIAHMGAGRVVATDASKVFLQIARTKTATTGVAGRIEFCQVDATDETALLSLGEGEYDAAVANMALMDMSRIEPLMNAMARLLRPGGRFIFSVTHPIFNSTGITKVIEEVTSPDGTLTEAYAVKVVRYASFGEGTPMRGTGIVGQPVSQIYFERTLSHLLAPAFRAGLLLDALEEPRFEPGDIPARAMSWLNFPEIPPFMVARLRRPPGPLS